MTQSSGVAASWFTGQNPLKWTAIGHRGVEWQVHYATCGSQHTLKLLMDGKILAIKCVGKFLCKLTRGPERSEQRGCRAGVFKPKSCVSNDLPISHVRSEVIEEEARSNTRKFKSQGNGKVSLLPLPCPNHRNAHFALDEQ